MALPATIGCCRLNGRHKVPPRTAVPISSLADLQKLGAILAARGYSPDDVALILGRNWIRFFEQHLP